MDKKSYRVMLMVVVLLFLIGAVIGCIMASRADSGEGSGISEYLRGYADSLSGDSAVSPVRCALNAFLFPTTVFLLGFAAFGILMIPALLMLRGFILAYCVTLFISAFGLNGFWPAMAALGIPALITIPCMIVLSVYGGFSSLYMLSVLIGRNKNTSPAVPRITNPAVYGICAVSMTVCALLEYYLTPALRELVLPYII